MDNQMPTTTTEPTPETTTETTRRFAVSFGRPAVVWVAVGVIAPRRRVGAERKGAKA